MLVATLANNGGLLIWPDQQLIKIFLLKRLKNKKEKEPNIHINEFIDEQRKGKTN